MGGPIYKTDSKIFLFYVGLLAEQIKLDSQFRQTMGQRFVSDDSIDYRYTPKDITSIDDILRTQGLPQGLAIKDWCLLSCPSRVTFVPSLPSNPHFVSLEELDTLMLNLERHYRQATMAGPQSLTYMIEIDTIYVTKRYHRMGTSIDKRPVIIQLELYIQTSRDDLLVQERERRERSAALAHK